MNEVLREKTLEVARAETAARGLKECGKSPKTRTLSVKRSGRARDFTRLHVEQEGEQG